MRQEEGAALRWMDALAKYNKWRHLCAERDKAHHSRGPREMDMRQEAVEHDGVYRTTDTAAGGDQANGNATLLTEVGGADRYAWEIQETGANADAEALRE